MKETLHSEQKAVIKGKVLISQNRTYVLVNVHPYSIWKSKPMIG